MSNYFREKYTGPVGRIFDSWASDPLNQEIGEIYEKHVFGKGSIDVNDVLNEYVGKTTGGKVSYTEDLSKAKGNGIIKG